MRLARAITCPVGRGGRRRRPEALRWKYHEYPTIAGLRAHGGCRGRWDLSGTYVIDHSASDDPRKAVEKATSSLRRFKRNAVNSRLQDAMKTPDTLHITQRGDSVMLATSGRLHMTVVPGQPTSRTGQRGGTAETAGAWVGNALVVRTTASNRQDGPPSIVWKRSF